MLSVMFFASPKFAFCQQIVNDVSANQLAFIYSLIYLPSFQPKTNILNNIDNIIGSTILPANAKSANDTITGNLGTGRSTDNNAVTDNSLAEMKAVLLGSETDILISKFAEMMEVEPEDMENYPLYKFIDKWYGVKYKFGGKDNSGIDCSAFSQKVYGSIYNVNIMRTARQQHRTSELIKNYEAASEGDLVFFRIHRIRVSHVGVYLANGYFVHASRSRGVMISSLNDKYWQRRYAGCGRVERADVIGSESGFLQ